MMTDIPHAAKQTFVGRNVILRPMTEEDITPRYLSWFSDDTVTSFLQARNITLEDAREHLRRGWETRSYYMYALCVRETGLHIGNVKIGPIIWFHRTSDLVTIVGDRDWWGRGIGSEAICLGSQAAFREWDIRKLHGAIVADNVGSVKAYTRGGWVVEGRLRGQALLPDGSQCDSILVSCFNPAYFSDSTFPEAVRHHHLAER